MDNKGDYLYAKLLDGKTQDRLIDFVIHKKKQGIGAGGIDNYINALKQFYWVNSVKGIDWELVRSYRPERVKKTRDREYQKTRFSKLKINSTTGARYVADSCEVPESEEEPNQSWK